jgi:hypothetical protein
MGGKTGLNASVFTLRIQFKILHKVGKILRVGTTREIVTFRNSVRRGTSLSHALLSVTCTTHGKTTR